MNNVTNLRPQIKGNKSNYVLVMYSHELNILYLEKKDENTIEVKINQIHCSQNGFDIYLKLTL